MLALILKDHYYVSFLLDCLYFTTHGDGNEFLWLTNQRMEREMSSSD